MPLVPLEFDAVPVPLPAPAACFLASVEARIEAWFRRPEHRSGIGFIPSDHPLVYAALAALRRMLPDATRLLEWGSGFGAVTGLAAGLGFAAHGIELDGELVASSRQLLAAHRLQATIAHGSFVPPGVRVDRHDDLETRTVLDAEPGYDALGRDLDDFDVVFAYPWPTEEAMYCDWFRQRADHGAVLLTYSRLEGVRAYRKLARGGGRRR